jgi:hypothetical protein
MTLALDPSGGFTSTFSSASSGTITVSTTNASILVIVVACEATNATGVHRTVSSITATGLTFNPIPSTNTPKGYNDNTGAANAYNTLEIWYAVAASPLSSVVVTVNLSGACDDAVLQGFGVNGVNTSTPADSNSSLAVVTTFPGFGGTTGCTGVSTTNANTFMILAYETVSNFDGGPISGMTALNWVNNGGGSNNCSLGVAYQIYSSTQSSISLLGTAAGGGNGWIAIAVALQASVTDVLMAQIMM